MLAAEFGKENVLVHSEYHIQLAISGTTKKHDIWLTKFGQLKWKLCHPRDTASGSPEKMIRRFKDYSPQHTDLAEMHSARDLCTAISRVSALAAKNQIERGVFCDAGFKGGRARISVVAILGERVEAVGLPVEAKDINEAETAAINYALTHYLDADLVIYSDSQSVVNGLQNPRVKWIPRENNKPADSLANLRGNKR